MRHWLAKHPEAPCVAAMLFAVVAPYWKLLLGLGIILPDDFGASDFLDVELATRVEVARLLRAGELPVWTPNVLGGAPLTNAQDPLSVLLFSWLPPALAMNFLLVIALVVTASGSYALGRRLGMIPWAAALTGFAFAWSGYYVCQLRHVGTILTVCWGPLGFAFLHDALSAERSRKRAAEAALGFAAVFALQTAAGYPQSSYIFALAYAVFSLGWATQLPRREAAHRLGFLLVGILVGSLPGMYQLLPLWEFGQLSSRAGRDFTWASQHPYQLKALWTFVWPYRYGDPSRLNYRGGVFWEEYGYVGLAPTALAAVAVARLWRDRRVWVFAALGLGAFLMVLGSNTPFFSLAYHLVPGMAVFRLPTRFLVITDLALCVLGGLGLTALSARRPAAAWNRLLGPAIFALTVANLWWVQARQNPIDSPRGWIEAPTTAHAITDAIARDPELVRVFTLWPVTLHMEAIRRSHGWSDLRELRANRDFLSPNSNLLWGMAAAGGYLGLYSRWSVAVWGGHSGEIGVLDRSLEGDRIHPSFFRLLELFNVRYLLTAEPLDGLGLTRVPTRSQSPASVYRLRGTLPRAWWVPRGHPVHNSNEAAAILLGDGIDPRSEVILHGNRVTPERSPPSPDASGSVRMILRDRSSQVEMLAQANAPGWLVLSDSYYPGWEATVDGRVAPIIRANLNARAVRLSAGTHRVTMEFKAPMFWRGVKLSLLGLALLLGAALRVRRMREPEAAE